MVLRLAVIGAGAVGLATAVQLQRALPQAMVTVIADKFLDETTSSGAAGLCRPTPKKTPGVPLHVFTRWLDDSWNYYSALAQSEDAGQAGCQITSGYEFFNTEQDNKYLKRTLFSHEKVSEKELNMYPGPRFSVGYRGTSILVSPKRFLPYLMNQFQESGGQFEKRYLKSLEELVGQYDIVMNCTALASRQLVNDNLIFPRRGHVIKFQAPWIKNYYYYEDGKGNMSHVYPTPDFVVVGGILQDHNEDLTPKAADRDAILSRAYEMIPSLKKAEIIGEWVGLRPMRNPLRLELEMMHFRSGGGALPVVHCYGHGGEGINLSWGTGAHAVRLAVEYASSRLTSKL